MRDDIDKLPIPASAKRYARMTSKEAFAPGKGDAANAKTSLFIDQTADTTNQQGRKQGFKNKDAAGKVQHSMKENIQLSTPSSYEDIQSEIEGIKGALDRLGGLLPNDKSSRYYAQLGQHLAQMHRSVANHVYHLESQSPKTAARKLLTRLMQD